MKNNNTDNSQKNPFSVMEEEVLAFWDNSQTFQKQVDKEAPKGDYVFYDGPPFATGLPHYGHIVGSIIKDVVPRYQAMKGHRVERKWGWDCHGLPIENIVEKELGSKSKKDIEAVGVAKFNELCRSKVSSYIDDWKVVIKKLGRWADMENSYMTMDLDYMESVWGVFKKMYDKGLIYEGYRSMHVCPRCETTLSQSEVSEGYKDVKDLSCIAKFELIDATDAEALADQGNLEKTFVLAWTTTPWTLIGNVALAVGAEIDYVKIKTDTESFILAKDLLATVMKEQAYGVVAEFKGSELIGKKYKPLFDYYYDKNEAKLNEVGDEKKVCALVIFDKGKVLLGLREYSKDKSASDFKDEVVRDFLMIPGGRSEVGENLLGTIAREIKEEINVDNFKIKKYLGKIDGYLTGDIVETFLLEVEDLDQIKNNEPEKFKEWKFFDIDEIPQDMLIRSTDGEFFADALKWDNACKIYAGDFITTTEGTGIVHIAPAFGDDDMRLGRENNLPFIQHVGMDGNFKAEVKDFAGLNVKPIADHMSTDIEIIKYLAHNNLLFSKEKYEHSYPHCWRCDTPLLNYATSSWFVNVTKIKPELLKNAEDINWSPAHIKNGRFGKWLEGARDWSISRQRFWASVMPIWRCDCGELKVLGSVSELEKLSGQKVNDIHKHIVDEISFPCEKCGGTMKRIPDVLDTWFDSGSMPYAQMHYPFENKEKFENNFPAEFIAEGVDQTRCWFYYLHVLGTGTEQKNAFKNVIVNGIVLAEDGKKMSKKLKNYPDPMEVFDKYGADALRYYLLTSPVMLADTLCFSEKGVQESLRKVGMLLWNVVKFYTLFKEEHDGELNIISEPKIENILDQWILARLNQLISEVTKSMDAYNLPAATRPVGAFIDDLSTWYIRRSRDRFKGDDAVDAKSALETTGYVLLQVAKVMAPFMPFMAEQVWQKVSGNEFKDENKSVHLENWTESRNMEQETDDKIILEMEKVRKIVELGLAKRDEVGIKVRQPLNQLRITNYELKDEYKVLVLDEVNVKEIIFTAGEGDLMVELDTEITAELKLECSKRELVRFINNMRKDADLSIGDRAIVYFETESEEIKTVVDKFKAEILKDTLANDLVLGVSEDLVFVKDVKVNDEVVKLGIKKV